MAGPTAFTLVVKKIITDALSDPEKLLKTLFYGVIAPILSFLLILALPIILILNVPSLLFSGNTSPKLTNQQLQTIAIYQDAPIVINQNNLNWIENKRNEYSWCDDIVVEYNYDLSWQHLMAIDAVLLNQDFSNAKKEDVLKLGNKFLIRNSYTETYTVEEEYEDVEEYEEDIEVTDPKTGKKTIKTITRTKTVTKIRTVTKHRAVIKISTKSLNQVLNEINLNTFEKDLALNMYNSILNADVEASFNLYDDVDLSELKEYPPGNASIPYFNQADKRWGAYSYGNSTIKSGGCGPTSLAMIVAGLKGRGDVNPKSVADWSYTNGHRAEGQGSYWSLMTAGGKNYGLKVEQVSRKNPKAIVKALSDGYPVIASMGRGHFTNGGHFIVLRGITADGKILVHDSASIERSSKAWDLGIIMNESSTNGGINGSPFWIFKP